MRVPPLAPRSSDRPYDVVVFGENSLDFVARLGDDAAVAGKRSLSGFETYTGGQGATAAIGCARLGLRVCYAGVFGRDDWAARSRDALEREGVEVVALERPGARSRIAVILVDAGGERTVMEYRDPLLTLDDPRVAVEAASRGRLVLVDAVDPAASLAVARAAREAGARTVIDIDRIAPNTVDLLAEIDVIVVPESFVVELSGTRDLEKALGDVHERWRPMAVVATRGEAGSLALSAGQLIDTPAFSVTVEDTTGAGDAFRAGFCAAWAAAAGPIHLEALIRYGAATAALNCRALGAQSGLPRAGDVASFLTTATASRSKM